MSSLRFLASLACAASISLAQPPLPEEGVGGLPLVPAPFTMSSQVLSSTNESTVLEVSFAPTDMRRLPNSAEGILGLVAIAPTGNVSASVIQADVARVSDIDNTLPSSGADIPPLVRLGTPAIWRDLRVVEVTVAPSWATPQGGLMARRLVMEITNTGGASINEKTQAPRPVSPVWDRMYRSHVLNYDSLNLPRLTRGNGNRYLVISRTAFDAQTPQFVEWKTRQGYGVEVVTLESLGYSGSAITGTTCLNATKNYILNAYNTWPDGLDFVLLIGDMYSSNYAGSVWTQTFYNYFYGQGNRPHDQWYGFLEGNDVFADIMVGRMSASSTADMTTLLGKTVGYEKTPYIDGTWQKRAIMTLDAGISETINVKNLVSDRLSAWGMNVSEYFSSPWNVTPAINQGVTFYNYRGDYCDANGWGSTFDTYDVGYVNNLNKLGVWTILSCSSGSFDYYNAILAEQMLRLGTAENPKGAVAFVGSQAYTAYEYNNPLDEGFYRCWADSGKSLLGEALLSGKVFAWNHMYPGFDPNRRDCMMKEYTILGDPSLQVWTDVPKTTTANVVPSTLAAGQTSSITVTVTNPTRGPVPDALVCLRKGGEVYVWGYTNGAGQVTLSATPATVGDVELTVTACNQQPVLSTVPVTASSGPYVVYDGNTILGDGYADVGDTVSMNIQLRNVGTQTAPSVQATLSTIQPSITMINATRNYGNIAAGATALPYSPFRFQVGTLADQTSVPFTLAINSGDSLWPGSFSITARAPILAVLGSTVVDPTGNGNGRPDPGETVDLQVQVQNNGTGPARYVQLALSESDPYVSLSGSTTQSLGTINSGSQVTSPAFAVVISPSCPQAHPVTLDLVFSSNYGTYTHAASLTLVVGQRELLYVDADDEATEGRITTALGALGVDYRRWNTYESGMSIIPLDTLQNYVTVLWAAGDQNASSVTDDNRANLASYLDQGGNLLLSAENYLTSYASASFTTEYLHVDSYQTSITGSGVGGTTGDPIGDGIAVTLSYHADLSDAPDRINPATGASTVFRLSPNDDSAVIRYPATGSATYRMVFFGAALEAFPTGAADPDNIESVIQRCLTWLGGDVLAPTAPSNPVLTQDGTLSWSPASDNVGVHHYCIYRSLLAYFEVQGMTPLTTTTGTSIQLTAGLNDPSLDYTYRITAQDAAGNQSAASPPVGEREFAIQ
ncbi:hypothetical protein JXA88_02710 [Candidatus Fermentibacteria bacterium]|nr:hypothetical protein [Candidatus Fermentibacteria bacterium]